MVVYLDVERPRVEGEGRMEGTWAWREVKVNKVSMEQKRLGSPRGEMWLNTTRKGCSQTTQFYKQNPEDNFEPYETKHPQFS